MKDADRDIAEDELVASWLEVRRELFAGDEHECVVTIGGSLGNPPLHS